MEGESRGWSPTRVRDKRGRRRSPRKNEKHTSARVVFSPIRAESFLPPALSASPSNLAACSARNRSY